MNLYLTNPTSMNLLDLSKLSPYALAIPLALVIIGLEVWLDRSEHTNPFRNPHESMANLMVGMMDLITRSVSQVLLLLLYILVFEHLRLCTLPNEYWMIPLGLIIYEFFYYWKHRMGHELNLMWASHGVHHQSRVMNFTASVRNSSTSGLWSIPFFLWIALLGCPPWLFLKAQILSHLWQFFLHTEKIGKLHPWIEFIFNTPSHHRVHHGTEEQYLDKNYGAVFILLDRVFGTFQAEESRPSYGTTDGISPRNPWQANFHHYGKIARALAGQKGLASAGRLLFGRPAAVMPDGTGKTKVAAPSPAEGHTKSGLQTYLYVQFFVGALCVFFYLSHVEALPAWLTVLDVAWLAAMLSVTGALLEGQGRWMLVTEGILLLTFPAMIWLNLYRIDLSPWPWVTGGFGLVGFALAVFVARFRAVQQAPPGPGQQPKKAPFVPPAEGGSSVFLPLNGSLECQLDEGHGRKVVL